MDSIKNSELLNEAISFILQANDMEIHEIMEAVSARYQNAFPDWDVVYIALPKNDTEARKRILDYALATLNNA